MNRIAAIILLVAASVYAIEFTPPPPDSIVACSIQADVQFIVDSSASIGGDNFVLVRDFIYEIVSNLDIGEDLTRVALARYTSWVDFRLFFNTMYDKVSILDEIQNTPYYGRGTYTSKALLETATHSLQAFNGWREQAVPTVAIVFTDGKAKDGEGLVAAANALKKKCTRVIAIGVGPTVDTEELISIASQPSDNNVFMATSFDDLTSLVGDLLDKYCEVDEDINECAEDNGGCQDICVNVMGAYYCECSEGYTLVDSTECVDIDECTIDNGGCSEICENTDGSFNCACLPGSTLAGDGTTCVPDSCFENTVCMHQCNNVADGDFYCSCDAGYTLDEDEVSCIDIDECLEGLSGCEHTCNNTDGSFFCSCPDGLGLRGDGRTCGVVCYVCERAATNEECQESVVCPESASSCQTETRFLNGNITISKRCKQPEACSNNQVQNPRDAVENHQCVDEGEVSVCRCCCFESYCNVEDSCELTNSEVVCPDTSTLTPPENGALDCSGNLVGDVCKIVCPEGYATESGIEEIFCNLKPRTQEGEWVGEASPCVDVDECAEDNGGCSHTCTNLNGTYECSCPNENPCRGQVVDIMFILDSSSSIGAENFQKVLAFVALVCDGLDIGQDGVRVGVVTYNRFQYSRIQLNEVTSSADFLEKLDDIEYSGRGTRTAAAIDFTARECLGVDQGRRPSRPLVTLVVTDGRSSDKKNMAAALKALNDKGSTTFAIGISDRVNEKELKQIAGEDTSRYRQVENFEGLNLELLLDLDLCIQSEEVHYMTSDGKTCDVDECAFSNGGCSDDCANTIGSYVCLCPEGEETVNDGKTCDVNECAVENGGCSDACVNTLGSFRCLCGNEYVPVDFDCADYDECSDANGGCSHTCVNLTPGYECTCPPGLAIDTDGYTCIEDSCFEQEQPEKCEQICTNIPGGLYTCSCEKGYSLDEDAHNCTEIDECATNNGGCQYECINFEGGYECTCPDGMFLASDGLSCVIKCYTCIDAESNEECVDLVTCPPSEAACFATIRKRGNSTSITKGCKQDLACINDLIQNPRDSGEGPAQCNVDGIHSKCECCCFKSECNAGVCPYPNELPTCPAIEAEDVSMRGVDEATGRVLPGGIAFLDCPEGFEPTFGGAGLTRIDCKYDFINNTVEWYSDTGFTEFDTCTDIDECATDNGGCVAPAFCENFEGGYECICPDTPDDYVLVDGHICERDECSDPDMGGCSHNCTNTIGSFYCFCPGELSLVTDGLTCDIDECRDDNGGCTELCINTLGGNECGCHQPGYAVGADGITCEDIDECLVDNGGCSDICNNENGTSSCSCSPGRVLLEDLVSCEDDPCYVDNGGCDQVCVAVDGVTQCECEPGYEQQEDGTCVDIDECKAGIAACSYNCTNTLGSFQCNCPPGTALDKDGITCGFACYSCHGAATNEECNANPMEVCREDSLSCENEVRVSMGVKSIFKRCKQADACKNNQAQNPRQAFLPTQCNGMTENDVCRCCCSSHLCNEAERVCAKPCNVNKADIAVILDSSSSVKFDNFVMMKEFVLELVGGFKVGKDAVHVALVRYNAAVDIRFDFSDALNSLEVMDAVRNTPYKGSGTKTGQAIEKTFETIFNEDNGMRPELPKICVVITDGNSRDDVKTPSSAMRDAGITTYAIGIGKVNVKEIETIAGSETRAFMASSFSDLQGTLLADIKASLCFNQDECATDNGGCSHECIDTDGSFRCGCPEDMILSDDLRTCVSIAENPDKLASFDECAEDNGGCSHTCIDLLDGYECNCPEFMLLEADNKTCSNINECMTNPCEYKCVDTEVGFFCECPADKVLNADGVTCDDRIGEGDCNVGYTPLAHTCVKAVAVGKSFAAAEEFCAADGGRLITVNDFGAAALIGKTFPGSWIGASSRKEAGVFKNSDKSVMSIDNWASGSPGDFDKCVMVGEDGKFATDNCQFRRASVCEQPRDSGSLVFTNTWPNGAQAKLYWPSGAEYVRVSFSTLVKSTTSWFCSVVRNEGTAVVFSQNAIELASGSGACEFVFEGEERVPVEACTVSAVKLSDIAA